jgi:hypothetical protein
MDNLHSRLKGYKCLLTEGGLSEYTKSVQCVSTPWLVGQVCCRYVSRVAADDQLCAIVEGFYLLLHTVASIEIREYA